MRHISRIVIAMIGEKSPRVTGGRATHRYNSASSKSSSKDFLTLTDIAAAVYTSRTAAIFCAEVRSSFRTLTSNGGRRAGHELRPPSHVDRAKGEQR